jgi:hypothetical protein
MTNRISGFRAQAFPSDDGSKWICFIERSFDEWVGVSSAHDKLAAESDADALRKWLSNTLPKRLDAALPAARARGIGLSTKIAITAKLKNFARKRSDGAGAADFRCELDVRAGKQVTTPTVRASLAEIIQRLRSVRRFLESVPNEAMPEFDETKPEWEVVFINEEKRRAAILVRAEASREAAARALTLNSIMQILSLGKPSEFDLDPKVTVVKRISTELSNEDLAEISERHVARLRNALNSRKSKHAEAK